MTCCTFGMSISGTGLRLATPAQQPVALISRWDLLQTSHNLIPTPCLAPGKIAAGCDEALLVSLDFHYGIIRIMLTNPLIIAV